MSLSELAQRCEQAAGANKMLDEAIFEALAVVPSREHGFVYPYYAYTASLDAAMTLVPEGSTWELASEGAANVLAPIPGEPGWFTDEPVQATTPALALCAAALKARAAQTGVVHDGPVREANAPNLREIPTSSSHTPSPEPPVE